MSWNSKLTATQKAKCLFLGMLFEKIDAQLKFPLPRGAFSYKEKPSWYDGKSVLAIVLEK